MADPTNPIPRVTRDDPGAGSGDVVAENVAVLKALFPTIVTDGKIDFDVLRQLLGDAVEEGAERYGLTWKGKARARAFALTPSLGTLRPAKADSKDWDTTNNIVIEGDNLEVLKLLRKSYAGKVKLIYIDPPYNTGSDFVYPDDYKQSLANYEMLIGQRGKDGVALTSNKDTSGRYHTDWLNMLYPRLILARDLLRDDGLIVVHCDEHEVDSLTLVLGEVFGPQTHLGSVIWDKRNPKGDAQGISYQHEYLLLFGSDPEALFRSSPLKRPKAGGADILEAARRIYTTTGNVDLARALFRAWFKDQPQLTGGEKMYNRLTDDGRVYRLVSMAWPNKKAAPKEYFIPLRHPVTGLPCPVPDRGWRNPPETMAALLDAGLIKFGEDETTQPQRVYFLDENVFENIPSIWGYAGSDDALLAELGIPFDHPKPVDFSRKIVSWLTKDEDVIVDFFAGSGTTGHALIAQNAADGGDRRYILVQLPEPLDPKSEDQAAAAKFCDKLKKPRTIAELTKERLRRAGEKIKADNPQSDVNTGFRVYKLATSNLKPWQPGDDFAAALLDATTNVLPGRSEDDLLIELLLKTGIDLALPGRKRTIAGCTVHSLGGGTLIVCLADVPATQAVALGDGIADWVKELAPAGGRTTFFFKDSGFDVGGNRAAEARANLAATLRQRLGDEAIEKLGAI